MQGVSKNLTKDMRAHQQQMDAQNDALEKAEAAAKDQERLTKELAQEMQNEVERARAVSACSCRVKDFCILGFVEMKPATTPPPAAPAVASRRGLPTLLSLLRARIGSTTPVRVSVL